MESSHDLNRLLAEWRRRMAERDIADESTLDELESHLLEQIDELIEKGLAERPAFFEAAARLGHEDLLATEYRKAQDLPLPAREPGRALGWSMSLTWSYLVVAWRQLRRQKGYAFINLAGLTISLASVLLIFLYVADEHSFDRFYEDADRIYAIGYSYPGSAPGQFAENTTGLQTETIYRELPEVEAATHMNGANRSVVRRGDENAYEDRLAFADSNFFDVFSYSFLEGDPRTALNDPYTMVITADFAQRYFGEASPLGEELLIKNYSLGDDPKSFRVTGLIDLPEQTSYPFDGLMSKSSWPPEQTSNYLGYGFIKLRKGAAIAEAERKLPSVVAKIAAGASQPVYEGQRLMLRPITSVHLGAHGGSGFAPETRGSSTYVLVLAVIGGIILLLACVNYINLSTARAGTRAREIGIRKVMGSTRGQLIRQHFLESLLLVFGAVLLALGVAQLSLSGFNAFVDKDLAFGLSSRWYAVPVLVVAGLLAALTSGIYPALYLTRFRPASILEGRSDSGPGRSTLRRLLVVFQFTVSIALIAATVLVHQQLQYAREGELGFDKEHILAVRQPWRLEEQEAVFEAELEQLAQVENVGRIPALPGPSGGSTGWTRLFRTPEEALAGGAVDTIGLPLRVFTADDAAIPTLGLEMAAGRNFRPDGQRDSTQLIVNEAAVAALGLEDPIGAVVYTRVPIPVTTTSPVGQPQPHEIVGVVNDYHYVSFHDVIPPQLFAPMYQSGGTMLVRIGPGDPRQAVASVEKVWTGLRPDLPFDYTWLDEEYESAYRKEARLSAVSAGFAGMAVLIACLGIVGLAAFTTQRRRKEIGIRKVLGATARSIVALLSSEFIVLVLIAFVIAVPPAFIGVSRWLESFAYRMEIGPGPFILAGLFAAALALRAVSFHAIRAALIDPAETLRNQ